ncbi:MAG TPA: ABC transporter permease subunit [Firmicutes bacterium]|nr:ABC transporter permease subunit [Bacillota bacterium]
MENRATSYRLRAIRALTLRELRSLFLGFGIYIVAAIALLGSSGMVSSFIGAVSDAGLQVSAEPLSMPFLLAIVAFTLYLGILATLAISRERDRGTLEVLFYGPVDSLSYVMAKFVQHVAAFVIIIIGTLIVFGLISMISGLVFTSSLIKMALLSLFFVSTAIAFGIFLSSSTSKTRNSIILFILIMLGFGLFSLLEGYVNSLRGDVPAIVENARVVVAWLSRGLDWISPVAYLSRGVEAARIGDPKMLAQSIVGPIIYTGILLWLSVQAFDRKGVRAR